MSTLKKKSLNGINMCLLQQKGMIASRNNEASQVSNQQKGSGAILLKPHH